MLPVFAVVSNDHVKVNLEQKGYSLFADENIFQKQTFGKNVLIAKKPQRFSGVNGFQMAIVAREMQAKPQRWKIVVVVNDFTPKKEFIGREM